MTDSTAKTTHICGYDRDTISIRGRDLVGELMGQVSFTEMMFLQIVGVAPSKTQTRLLDAVLVTIMEHGLVPSAVSARLTYAGAPESVQGAVAAGLLGVGERYAGTASECAKILEDIVAAPAARQEDVAREHIAAFRQARRPVPGFGHPVHSGGDPRVDRLIGIAETAGAAGHHIAALRLLETCLADALGRTLPTNVSAAIGAVLGEAGVPSGAMRGIVLTARCAGLAGHVFEESRYPIADDMWRAAEAATEYDPGG